MSIQPERLPHILDGPAETSPDGVYHLDNPPNRNVLGLVAAGLCMAIATAVVMLRAYSRLFCSRKTRIEDVLGIIGYVTFLGAFINVVLLSQTPGLWVHLWNIRFRGLESLIKVGLYLPRVVAPKAHCCQKQLAFDTCYGLTMAFVKAAVLVEWTHKFVPSGRNLFFWACYAVLFTNGLLFVAEITAKWLACAPQQKLWRPWETGRCFDWRKMEETVSSFDLFFNLVILLLPQRIVWKPHTTQGHKLCVSLVSSAGLLACACAAGRVCAIFRMRYNNDTSYHTTAAQLCGLAEGTCFLMVFCLGAASKVFQREKNLITDSSSLASQRSDDSLYRRMEDLPQADREAARVKPNGQFVGIIKTKEFFTHETPNTDDDVLFQDQHPWIQEHPKIPLPPRAW
ncbi:integral membrane protein PTH11 [Apiospora marii]|uniref:Integral membrane protein PTH11 n=1 Tax=Apiospora marii TaxID=335849 RepID=A0ABR1R2I9_9PEZI